MGASMDEDLVREQVTRLGRQYLALLDIQAADLPDGALCQALQRTAAAMLPLPKQPPHPTGRTEVKLWRGPPPAVFVTSLFVSVSEWAAESPTMAATMDALHDKLCIGLLRLADLPPMVESVFEFGKRFRQQSVYVRMRTPTADAPTRARMRLDCSKEAIELLHGALEGDSARRFGSMPPHEFGELLQTECDATTTDTVTAATHCDWCTESMDTADDRTVALSMHRLIASLALRSDIGCVWARAQLNVSTQRPVFDIGVYMDFGKRWPELPQSLVPGKAIVCVLGGFLKSVLSLLRPIPDIPEVGGEDLWALERQQQPENAAHTCLAHLMNGAGNRADPVVTHNPFVQTNTGRATRGGIGADALPTARDIYAAGTKLSFDRTVIHSPLRACSGHPGNNFKCTSEIGSSQTWGFIDDCEGLWCPQCVVFVKPRVHRFDESIGEIFPRGCKVLSTTRSTLLAGQHKIRADQLRGALAAKAKYSDVPVFKILAWGKLLVFKPNASNTYVAGEKVVMQCNSEDPINEFKTGDLAAVIEGVDEDGDPRVHIDRTQWCNFVSTTDIKLQADLASPAPTRTWSQVASADAQASNASASLATFSTAADAAAADAADASVDNQAGRGWDSVVKAKQQERKLSEGDLQETASVLEELHVAYKGAIKQKQALEATVRLQEAKLRSQQKILVANAEELSANAERRATEIARLETLLESMRLSSPTRVQSSPPADAKPDSPIDMESTPMANVHPESGWLDRELFP